MIAAAPSPGPLCPPRWAEAAHALVEDLVRKNSLMFEHFQEIDTEDLLAEAHLAACRSWAKFDPRKASPSRWIRRVSKCRLIDLYRQARLKHQRDRDYAPRQQARMTGNQLEFSRRLSAWLRQHEDAAAIDGDIYALLALWRLLARYCVRLEPIPIWRKIPARLKRRLNKPQYDEITARLRECVARFCRDDVNLISHSAMDHTAALSCSSLYGE